MKTMKKVLAALLCTLMIGSCLTGCIGNYVKPVDGGEESGIKLTPAKDILALERTKQTLEVWFAVSGNSGEMFTKLSQQFDAQSDLVDLTMSYSGDSSTTSTKVSAALLTDTYPDVALMYAGPLYTGERGDFTVNDLMDLDTNFNKADIYPGMLDYCNFMGSGIAAVPYGISTQVVYYNKAIVKAAGLDLEKNPPKTWAEFSEICKTILEKGNIKNAEKFYAFETSDEAWLFKSMLKQNECNIVEVAGDKVTPVYNNAAAKEVADYWYSLVENGYMPHGNHDNAENLFLSQGCAFIAASSNRISRWKSEDIGFELGAIEMPYFKTQTLALGGNVFVILATDPQKVAAAWDYISYMTSAENNATFALNTGYLPIRQSELETDAIKDAISGNPLYNIAFKQLDYTYAYIHYSQMGTMDTCIRSLLDELERNKGTSQELLDKYVEKLQKEINSD